MKLPKRPVTILFRQMIMEKSKSVQNPTGDLTTDAITFYALYTLLTSATAEPIPLAEHLTFQNNFQNNYTTLITQTEHAIRTTPTYPPKYQKDDAWRSRIRTALLTTTQQATHHLTHAILHGQAHFTSYFQEPPHKLISTISYPKGTFGILTESNEAYGGSA